MGYVLLPKGLPYIRRGESNFCRRDRIVCLSTCRFRAETAQLRLRQRLVCPIKHRVRAVRSAKPNSRQVPRRERFLITSRFLVKFRPLWSASESPFRGLRFAWLTKPNAIISPKLQLLSGHSEEKSLAIYRDLALADVAAKYESAMQKFPVRWLRVVLSQVPSRWHL